MSIQELRRVISQLVAPKEQNKTLTDEDVLKYANRIRSTYRSKGMPLTADTSDIDDTIRFLKSKALGIDPCGDTVPDSKPCSENLAGKYRSLLADFNDVYTVYLRMENTLLQPRSAETTSFVRHLNLPADGEVIEFVRLLETLVKLMNFYDIITDEPDSEVGSELFNELSPPHGGMASKSMALRSLRGALKIPVPDRAALLSIQPRLDERAIIGERDIFDEGALLDWAMARTEQLRARMEEQNRTVNFDLNTVTRPSSNP
ncbi:hypothetical protein PQX77_012506 [Marasmius sp. AFHP31]|nr:hypothetical protein PQX77_012506 [Marasmius sp. AFHP31]